jgi:hypothetical protein
MMNEARLRALQSAPDSLDLPAFQRFMRLNQLLSETVPEGSRMLEDYEGEAPHERVKPLLSRLSETDRDGLVTPAMQSLAAELKETGSLEGGALPLVLALAEDRPQLDSQLRALVLPRLGQVTIPEPMEDRVDSWIEQGVARAIEGFPRQDLPQRLAILDIMLALNENTCNRATQNELEEKLEEAFLAAGKAHPIMTHEREVLREVCTDPDGWEKGAEHYLELSKLVKNEALDVYQSVNLLRSSEDLDWPAARERMLRRHMHVPEKGPGSSVEVGRGKVTVGGVVVRGRQRTA